MTGGLADYCTSTIVLHVPNTSSIMIVLYSIIRLCFHSHVLRRSLGQSRSDIVRLATAYRVEAGVGRSLHQLVHAVAICDVCKTKGWLNKRRTTILVSLLIRLRLSTLCTCTCTICRHVCTCTCIIKYDEQKNIMRLNMSFNLIAPTWTMFAITQYGCQV